jgi:hypothetical protein
VCLGLWGVKWSGSLRAVRAWLLLSGVDGVAVYVYCVMATGCMWSVLGHDWLSCRCEVQERGETLLHAAASGGHAEVVRLMIEAGGDMNQATVCAWDCGASRGVGPSVLLGLGYCSVVSMALQCMCIV